MPTSSSQCDPELLQRSLNDDLTEQQEERLAGHLAECEACRQQLETLAGSRDDWSKISDALQEERSRRSVTPGGEEEADELDGASDVQRFIADFAVDFLEPAEAEGLLGRLDSIEIREVIGHGGNGIVLKGFQPELNRLVAAKVMAPHLASSAAARRRFAREAQATAAIVHPGVLPVLSVSSSGRLPYLVMPYVDCESLQQRIDREGVLPVIDVLRIGMQVARGLAAAHAQGLVHRDVKPANILLEKGVDRVMLTDFGLARAIDDASLTRSGLIAGTPQYMSPEQARGDGVDTRSDLFSLGSVLYAMCTGRPPFRAETSYGILRRVTDDDPRSIQEINSEIPEWLESIVCRLLSKNPEQRFGDAEQLAELLEDCVAHLQQPTANPLPAGIRADTDIRRSWKPPLWFVVCAGLVVCFVTAALLLPDSAPEGREDISGGSDRSEPAAPEESAGGNRPDESDAPVAGSHMESAEWNSSTEKQLEQLDDEINELLMEVEQEWIP